MVTGLLVLNCDTAPPGKSGNPPIVHSVFGTAVCQWVAVVIIYHSLCTLGRADTDGIFQKKESRSLPNKQQSTEESIKSG